MYLHLPSLLLLTLLSTRHVQPAPVDLDLLEDVLRDLIRSEEVKERSQRAQETPDPGRTALTERGLQALPLRVAAFNVRMYGDKKYADTTARGVLIKILGRYDVTLIQEIRDAEPPESFYKLIDDLKQKYGSSKVGYVLSARLGRSTSKEQYAYIYNPERLQVVSTYTYADPNDDFERPPYTVLFRPRDAALSEFGVVGIHTKPSKAEDEIDHLTDVYNDLTTRFNTENMILMGDFNADCSYVTGKEWSNVRLRSDPRFSWLINDGVDTTVAKTHCAYDRFVIAGREMKQAVVAASPQPFRFDIEYGLNQSVTERVSDHYPIELEIYGAVSPEVKATQVQESFTILSPEDATANIMRMLTQDKRTYRYFAYLKPSIVTVGANSLVELTRTVSCKDVVARMDRLKKQRPELMSLATVAMVQSYMAVTLDTAPPRVPGLVGLGIAERSAGPECTISVQYDGPQYNKYKVTVSKRIQ